MGTHAGIDDLHDVLQVLVDIGKKWFALGLALRLRQPTLQKIRDNHNNDVDDCKLEMLTQWLNKVDKSNPSWKSLADALRDPTVKCEAAAHKIERNI